MLAFRAKRADIAWTVVHQAVANHLVLALESFATFGARAACNWAVVRSTLAVHVLVGASEHLLVSDDTPSKRCTGHTLAGIASGMSQLCSL